MASFLFKREPSDNRTKRYSVRFSREGEGLGRKRQMTADDMTNVTEGQPRNWPAGTDDKAPFLPNEVKHKA